jgi:prepilin-type N-terminal cleavage/methylation domain-containing protein
MNKKQGFTLIELMVVMALLAILLGIGAGAFVSSLKKGRDNTRKANLRAITSALEMYYNDKGKYPVGDSAGMIKGCGTDAERTVCPAANGAFQDETPTPPSPPTLYMAKLPTDPVSSLKYYYVSAGASYQIYAHLENSQDPQCLQSNCLNPTVPGGVSCGTSVACNYGISSGNTTP